MNCKNFSIEPNPQNPGDYIIKGDIYNNDGVLVGDFGPDGTSIFAWWITQDSNFQFNYALQFSQIMAQQIGSGVAE